MEELEEIKKLRKQIREMILNVDELKDIKSLKPPKDLIKLKKECYTMLVDLKNEFEAENSGNDNNEDTINKINKLTTCLNQVKKLLSKQI